MVEHDPLEAAAAGIGPAGTEAATALSAQPTIDRAVRRVRVFGYALWVAIALRTIADVAPIDRLAEWVAVVALLAYAALLATVPAWTRRFRWYAPPYIALQAALVLALFLLLRHPDRDYFAVLAIPLGGQAVLLLPSPWRARAVGLVLLAPTAGILLGPGWPDGAPLVLLFGGSVVFAAAYASLVEGAETARERSRLLLADLQAAYRRLEASAAQAEELAAVQERTRLARDLHDSAAQTLFGLTLSAEAASRALARGEQPIAAAHLRETQESARRALAELRLLVFELRPTSLSEDGLAASLRTRLEAVERRAGLDTDLAVEGDDRPSAPVEAELDRIAQEALNNVIKHARAERVAVRLRQDGPTTSLIIVDDGAGFDPSTPAAGGGLGLRGMAERAARIGGRLEITAGPGDGTRVAVEVPG